jgi:RNA polymerase sigma factor (sigma-70 family)
VKKDHGPGADGAASFHTTDSAVNTRAAPREDFALAEICRLYWYPLYVFARRRGHSPDDAQDLTQGFFLHLLERRALTDPNQLNVKSRSFLRTAFRNYLSDAVNRARCLKRGGDKRFLYLDTLSAGEHYRRAPTESLTAEKILDARWAMTLLAEALSQLREEYATKGKASKFEALEVFLDPVKGETPPSYEQVANQLQVSTSGVKTLIYRLRKRYTALLRGKVSRGVSDPSEIDAEIHSLCEALVASEGLLYR